MKLCGTFLLFLLCGLELHCSPQPYTRRVESEKIQGVVSRVMEKNLKKASDSVQEEALKEFETFLSRLETQNHQQAEALHQLGNLFMAMEEEQIRQDPNLLYTPRIHSYSISVYERIRSRFPLDPGNDEVLYQLAHGYDEENRRDNALLVLRELTGRFSRSAFYAEALFRIGDIYFDEGKYPEATEAYFKALEANPQKPLMEKASYKIIWSYFKMQDYQKTVDMIINTLNRHAVSRKDGTRLLDVESLSEQRWEQVKELLHLAVLSFDFWGGAAKARNYFDFHGHVSYENLIYRPLGYIYLNRGKFQEAGQTFEMFLTLYPNHEEAPNFQMDLLETYQKAERLDLARRARAALIAHYRPGGGWWKENSPLAHERVMALRKDILFQAAEEFHGDAQKTRKKEDYLTAIQAYQAFLKEFPKAREASRIQYNLAEAFFETGQYEQAAVEYETAAYQFPLHSNSEEAGLAALISYEKIFARQKEVPNPLVRQFINACKLFLKTFPDTEKKQDILLKAELVAFQAGNGPEGRSFARQILDLPRANTPVKVQTHFLLAKSFFDERDFDKAETEFQQTAAGMKRPDYQDPEGPRISEINTYLASLRFKKAELLKNQQKYGEAARAFLKISEEFPDSEIAPVSLMHAGSAFLEAGDPGPALNSFLTVSQRYPRSTYLMEARAALLSIYEKQNHWEEAAREYEFLIEKTSDPVKKSRLQDSLYSLWVKTANWEKLYHALNPELKSRAAHPVKWLYFYALSEKQLHLTREAVVSIDDSLTAFKKTGNAGLEEEEWAMKSLLLKGEILTGQFVSVRLTHPLEKNLPLKREKFKETLEVLSQAAQSNLVEISSEALYHIGGLFEQFAEDLNHSERPGELNNEQREIYEGLLKNQIDPLYQKAMEMYQKNLQAKNPSDNEWIKKSEERLNQLQAEKKG